MFLSCFEHFLMKFRAFLNLDGGQCGAWGGARVGGGVVIFFHLHLVVSAANRRISSEVPEAQARWAVPGR